MNPLFYALMKRILKTRRTKTKRFKNGLPDTMEILNREEALKLEPNLSEYVVAALRLPTGGIVSPYEFNIALAESAAMNGVEFKLETEIIDIEKKKMDIY